MDKRINPFHNLYVTEAIEHESFVRLFSPVLVEHALALFQPGNIFLKGFWGTGKSMLLMLLRPETMLAYEKAGIDFPVPKEFSKFIGATINITRCGILDFGQRKIKNENAEEGEILPIYFGDFFNYWVVADILSTIDKYIENPNTKTVKKLGIDTDQAVLDKFAISLASDACWFGYLDGVHNYQSLKELLAKRIQTYRSFFNYNIDEIPESIRNSKTRIGAPISNTAEKLRVEKVLPCDVSVIVVVDQYEELINLVGPTSEFGTIYQQIINKAIGLRDPRVSYRVGTRKYAMTERMKIFGSESFIEKDRNYKVIDIDEIMMRQENKRIWVFPEFAKDVFYRRVKETGYHVEDEENVLHKVFKSGLTTEEKAKKLATKSPRRLLNIENSWPKKWVDFLNELADEDPLSAKLAEAWCRQKDKHEVINNIPSSRPYPWEEKQYWKKERINIALMQIAGRCAEKLTWGGVDDVLALSGGNILAFLCLCQHIWSAWIRDMRGLDSDIYKLPIIDPDVQTVGIYEASSHWFEKITSVSGGFNRQQFISYLGTMFYREMYEDKAMSYPGHNGFSIKIKELSEDSLVKNFLNDAAEYGDLYEAEHSSKSKDKEKRIKFYLTPILSPYFKVPVQHTKEPKYCNIKDVKSWLSESGAMQFQRTLFS